MVRGGYEKARIKDTIEEAGNRLLLFVSASPTQEKPHLRGFFLFYEVIHSVA